MSPFLSRSPRPRIDIRYHLTNRYCIGESTWGTTDSIEEGASGFVTRFEKAARLEGLPVDDPRAEIRLKEALTWS